MLVTPVKIKKPSEKMLTKTSVTSLESNDFPSNYDPICLLGSGTFGQVYLATRKADGQVLALKIVEKSPKRTTQNLNEKKILQRIESGIFSIDLISTFET